jgi:hypothetical protein
VGGDDFWICVTSPREYTSIVSPYYSALISRQIGHLKEFTVETMNPSRCDTELAGRYCKKVVEVKGYEGAREDVIRFTSRYHAPLMSALLDAPTGDEAERGQHFDEFYSGVLDMADRHPAGISLLHAYVEVYQQLNGLPENAFAPGQVWKHPDLYGCTTQLGPFRITDAALRKVEEVMPIEVEDQLWRYSNLGKALSLVESGTITLRQIESHD